MQLVGGSGDAQAQKLMQATLAEGSAFNAMAMPVMPAPGLPSSLLERRPDIARAQLQLAASDSNLAAQRDQAAYAYRGVVIKALGDVETALVSTEHLQTKWQRAKAREKVLSQTLGFAKDRYDAGYASYLEELDAQRNLFAVQQEVVRLRQSQLENAVALYQALGGGWQSAAQLPEPQAAFR